MTKDMEEENLEKPIILSQALKRIEAARQELEMLLFEDLSQVHVDDEWSCIPHLGEHVQFLHDQLESLAKNLKEGPPVESQ